jgi:hypothetical protein
VIVAVVAGGSSDPGADAAATSTTARATTSTNERRTTTSRTSTTDPPETQPTAPAVHEPWLPDQPGLQLVMGASGGQVLRVDLATGRTQLVRAGYGIAGTPDAAQVIAGRLLVSNGAPLQFIDLGSGEVVDVEVDGIYGSGCGAFPSDTPDRMWLARCGDGGPPTSLVEYSFVDRGPTAELALPAGYEYIAGWAPGLGFVLQAAGGIYVLGTDGTVTRPATGRVNGVIGDFALRRECDEALRCSVTLIDLGTSEERPVTFDERLAGPSPEIQYPFSVSPAGNYALVWVQLDAGRGQPALLDVTAGRVVPLPVDGDITDGDGTQPVWSRDGRWLFGRAHGDVWAVDLADGRSVELEDLPGTRLFGAVSATPA